MKKLLASLALGLSLLTCGAVMAQAPAAAPAVAAPAEAKAADAAAPAKK